MLLLLILILPSSRSAWAVNVNERLLVTLWIRMVYRSWPIVFLKRLTIKGDTALLQLSRVKRDGIELSTCEELEKKLTCALLKLQEGWAIHVDGQAVVHLATKEDADAVVEKLLHYFPPEVGSELKDIYIKESVEPVLCMVEASTFVSADEALSILIRGTKEEREYEIKAGDSLWSIARVHDMYVDDIKAANPGISENLQIGQKISLVVPKPYVTVVSHEEKTVAEAIPFEIKTVKDSDLYTYERKVRTAGNLAIRKLHMPW